MLMLKTLPAAKGSRNIKAKLDPRSRSFYSKLEIKTVSVIDFTFLMGVTPAMLRDHMGYIWKCLSAMWYQRLNLGTSRR